MKKSALSLSILWIGVVLLITGIVLTFFGIDYASWAFLGIMGGILGILIYVVVNYTQVIDFFVEYSTRQWANTVIFIVLLVGIVIIVQMIANNHNYRFDLTPEGELSLAPITRKVLNDVAYPIKATGFYRRDERAELADLLEMYRLATKKFTYELYDLDRNPGLANRYDVRAYGTAVVEVNQKQKKVTFPTEEKIINAILSLTNPVPKVVYFLSGHGEYDLKGTTEDDVTYGLVKESLETENYLVKTILFVGGKPVPDDASLVVIGGPKTDFTKADVQSLTDYVKKGGKVMVAIGPDHQENLEQFLKEHGIAVGDDLVVDPEDYLIEKNPLVPLVPFYMTHPITENFTIPTVFPLVRSVNKGSEEVEGVTVKTLARSGKGSWAETDVQDAEEGNFEYDPKVDQKGPITVAVVAEIKAAKPKEESGEATGSDAKGGKEAGATGEGKKAPPAGSLVVFGDSDFLVNKYFQLLGNKDLFLNTVHWMTEDEALISLRQKRPSAEEQTPFYLSPMHARMIFIWVVIFQPVLVLAIGIVVAWRRRQKG